MNLMKVMKRRPGWFAVGLISGEFRIQGTWIVQELIRCYVQQRRAVSGMETKIGVVETRPEIVIIHCYQLQQMATTENTQVFQNKIFITKFSCLFIFCISDFVIPLIKSN